MKNNLFKVLTLIVLTSMLLAGCGGQPAAAPAPKELNVWITWGDNPQQLQELFDKYGKANGIKVTVTAPVEADKVLPALTGSEPPDVLILGGGDLV